MAAEKRTMISATDLTDSTPKARGLHCPKISSLLFAAITQQMSPTKRLVCLRVALRDMPKDGCERD